MTMRRAAAIGTLAGIGALAAMLAPAAASAASECKLQKLLDLPATMINMKPVVTAGINGRDVRFVADSGAFYSLLTDAAATQFQLHRRPILPGFYLTGIGGDVRPTLTTVKDFKIGGIVVHDVEFLVGGSDVGGTASVGLLGQNVFRIGDVEYDLANGVIRLWRSEDCRHSLLAYWAKPDQPYSVMDLEWATAMRPHTKGTASLNGRKLEVTFDTGAFASLLSLKVAERAGLKPDSPGVEYAGYSTGIGRGATKTYIGRFDTFKVGDEEIRNARLRFGDTGGEVEMLLGADFFLSHHLYVASREHKLFFTYNGGPVFNLTARTAAPAGEPPEPAEPGGAAQPQAGTEPAKSTEPAKTGPDPAAAAEHSRRGTASASRRDYPDAIRELTLACELDPANPEYFVQRGEAYQASGSAKEARADFDRAIELEPDHIIARATRASLEIRANDFAAARADLDRADAAAPKEADIRFLLAQQYSSADAQEAVIRQLDFWIEVHESDARIARALDARCRARAWLGQDLAKALADCNRGLRIADKKSDADWQLYDSRGLVRLRMGDFDKAIADYDTSLKARPHAPTALYGRGLAKLKRNQTAEGQADLAEAGKLRPKVAEWFAKHGISP
jgi:tetratricopeptide (TPR) repeat protein/predicted aspartyl protease